MIVSIQRLAVRPVLRRSCVVSMDPQALRWKRASGFCHHSCRMFHVILYQPEIPPNTGNIIRMCANSGAHLHLIEPLGFDIDEKAVRRSGMDYAELADVKTWPSLEECFAALKPARWFAVSTRGTTRYDTPRYAAGDAFVFGPETRGLPQSVLESCAAENRLRIPMRSGNRSLNLSNAAAVLVFEAWRQNDFA